MKDPLFELPQELNPDFHVWKQDVEIIDYPVDVAAIRDGRGQTLALGASGGNFDEKAQALASRLNLKGLFMDGRNIPQPLIDAAGEIRGLERLHLGFIGKRSLTPLGKLTKLKSLYLEGAKGEQAFSIQGMTRLRSMSLSGDADAVETLLRDGNATVKFLLLGGTLSANLRLADLEILRRFPGLEYLALLDVSVKSRSLEPCLALPELRRVIVNFARSWRRDSIEALEQSGVPVRCRMDEVRAQMS